MIRNFLAIVFLFIGLLISAPALAPYASRNLFADDIRRFAMHSLSFTSDRFYEYLLLRGRDLPDSIEIPYGQAYLETGNFSSYKFIHFNNLFGLKKPVKRKTTATGTYR